MTTEVVRVHPEEPGAIAMLDQAIHALTTALDRMPIGEVVTLKAKVATVATATKELGMSKEAQELAVEAVRRAEWALGRAIRKGQAEGTVAPHGGTNAFNKQDVAGSSSSLPRPLDFGSRSEIYGSTSKHGSSPGALNLADNIPDPDDFEAAIEEAKAEGNLSRANVARKAREKSGRAPEPAPAGTAERAHQEAELINAFGSIVRRSLTPKHVATLSPKARRRLVSILNQALDLLKETDQ